LSFAAGKVISHEAGTKIADGLACRLPVEEDLDVILKNVDRIVEVSEGEIQSAMRAVYEDTHNIAEGAAAASIAAVLKDRAAVNGRRVGAVLTGGNVDREVFLSALGAA
jgi:threonine dehydratase